MVIAVAVLLAVSCCLISVISQDAEGADNPVKPENGASLTETIQSAQAGDNLTIVLTEGYTYTLTGVGFAGDSLTIQGNNATVSVIDTPHENNGQTTYQSA